GQLSAITKTIEDAAPDRREVLQAQLAGALAVLSEVITTCDKLTAKNRATATLDAASVSAELNGLQNKFQRRQTGEDPPTTHPGYSYLGRCAGGLSREYTQGATGRYDTWAANRVVHTLSGFPVLVVPARPPQLVAQPNASRASTELLASSSSRHHACTARSCRAAIILGFLDANPDLESVTLSDQVNGMLIKPLEHPHWSIPADKSNKLVILIDALDERKFLSSVIKRFIHVRARQASPHEPPRAGDSRRVRFSMGAVAKRGEAARVHARADLRRIRAYLEHSFSSIRDKHELQAVWPSRTDVDELVRRSEQAKLSPQKRLENILTKTGAEGPPKEKSLYAQVDDLYLEILRLFAGSEDEPGHTDLCDHVRQIVAAVVLGLRPMSVAMISSILGLELEDVRTVVRGLGALWIVPATDDIPISLFHESFPISFSHAAMHRRTVSTFSRHWALPDRPRLSQRKTSVKSSISLANLPLRDQIPDLNGRLDLHVPAHLKYSVEHWIDHFARYKTLKASPFCPTLRCLSRHSVTKSFYIGLRPVSARPKRLLHEFLVAVQNFERRSDDHMLRFTASCLRSYRMGAFSQVFRTPSPDSSLTNPDSAFSSVYINHGWCGFERTHKLDRLDRSVIVHNVTSGREARFGLALPSTPTHRIPARDFALSPLGTTFALSQGLGYDDYAISVWSSNSTAPLACRALNKKCLTLAFEPDGGRIICVFDDAIQLIDVSDLRDISGTRRRLEHEPSSASFIAGDSALAVYYDGWKPRTLTGLPRVNDGAGPVTMSADQSITLVGYSDVAYLVNSDPALGFLQISATKAALSPDGEVAVWDVNTGDRITIRSERAYMLQVMPISSPSPAAPPHDVKMQRIIAQSMCGVWVAIVDRGYGETLAEAPTFSIWNLTSGAALESIPATTLTQKIRRGISELQCRIIYV
ncbi:hypothetical protein BKA62DRAFT_680299, partial [Auriculariales sp. MPI-PUGE-AT-0066]